MILSYLASEHLARAKAQLSTRKPEALFYAALELRFSVESRLDDYSKFASQIRPNKKGSWSVKALSKHVDKTFQTGAFAYEVTFSSPKLSKNISVIYTPVSLRLKKIAERLGDYLHISGAIKCSDEKDFLKFRTLLEEGVSEMEFSSSGELHGPPIQIETGTLSLSMDVSRYPELRKLSAGEKLDIRIQKLNPIEIPTAK